MDATRVFIAGDFEVLEQSHGGLRLRHPKEPLEVYAQLDEGAVLPMWKSDAIQGLEIEWRADATSLTLFRKSDPVRIHPRSVVVHRYRRELDELLPHPPLDARARRFWRIVFGLVRLPGGRRLLGFLARRSPKPPMRT